MSEAGYEVRTFLWYIWAEIAVDNEYLALDARRSIVSDGRDAAATETEMKASLLAITAVGHSLDALQLALVELGCVPEETLSAWSKRGPKQRAKVLATLRYTFGDYALAPSLPTELEWLYEVRNDAVHNQAPIGPIVVHPALGTRTTPARVRYGVENATRAVDLLIRVLETVSGTSEPQSQPALRWSRSWRPGISEIVGRRQHASAQHKSCQVAASVTDS